jgi:hypothetical protein
VLLYELTDAYVALLNKLSIDLQMEFFSFVLLTPLIVGPRPRGRLLFRSDEAKLGIFDDFFDRSRPLIRFRFGDVAAGYLKAIEQKAGAAGIDLVGGDAAQDFTQRELKGGTIRGIGEVELIAFLFAQARVLDGRPVGGVVVAEVLAAQRPGAATPSVGVDMAAAVAGVIRRCGGFGGGLFDLFGDGHDGYPPPRGFVAKYSNIKT